MSTNLRNLAENALDSLLSRIEEIDKVGSLDCCGSEGAVEITNEEVSYLISWHSPSSQIWVASPISGSVRFNYDEKECLWCTEKGAVELVAFVISEIGQIFGIPEK